MSEIKTILTRAYPKLPNPSKTTEKKFSSYFEYKRILVFDTETTVDQFQNLKFGFFRIYDSGVLLHEGLFYEEENLTKEELTILKEHAKQKNIGLYTRESFVLDIFYPQVYDAKALCLGYNLAFDLSRLAISFGDSRKKDQTFSLELTPYKNFPRIMITHKGGNIRFISFGAAYDFFKKHNKDYVKGNFLDLCSLACTLADKKRLTLRQAGELYNTDELKSDVESHGELSPEYVDYCIQDVKATYSLYDALLREFHRYGINVDLCSIYSAASLGKSFLNQMKIKPFNVQMPHFSSKIKGHCMSAYYGGRCELLYRKMHATCSVLDFRSEYPTVSLRMNIWKLIIAKNITTKDVTQETIKFLSEIDLKKLQNKEIFEKMIVLVKLEPEEDFLPIRGCYKEDSKIPNIGINYLTYHGEVYYALPDVVTSVLETNKVPNVLHAIEFIPDGVQEGLKQATIFGVNIDPRKENPVKAIIEARQKIKNEIKQFPKESQKYKELDSQQRAMKILANAMIYGIFVEMNRKGIEETLEIFAEDDFVVENAYYDEEGTFFNPIISVMQTACARLFLAMAETFLKNKSAKHFYSDTDSMFVPPEHAKDLRDFFQPLNPYSDDEWLFKIDKENTQFYAISSKRYVLYTHDGKNIEIVDTEEEQGYKLHGLGHLKNPFNEKERWHKEIWMDLLRLHHGYVTEQSLQEKYSKFYAVSSLTVSTPFIWLRFKKFNTGKPLNQQIKPFNFFLVGVKAKGDVKPIAPFSKISQEAVYKPFIDYSTGRIMEGEEYWCDLWEVIKQYMNHPESKFYGDIGFLQRKHIYANHVQRISKEIVDLDKHIMKKVYPEKYLSEKQKCDTIRSMSIAEAERRGVSKRTFLNIRRRVNDGKKIKWSGKDVMKLI